MYPSRHVATEGFGAAGASGICSHHRSQSPTAVCELLVNMREVGRKEEGRKEGRDDSRGAFTNDVALVGHLLEVNAPVVAPPDAGDKEAELLFVGCWWHDDGEAKPSSQVS